MLMVLEIFVRSLLSWTFCFRALFALAELVESLGRKVARFWYVGMVKVTDFLAGGGSSNLCRF